MKKSFPLCDAGVMASLVWVPWLRHGRHEPRSANMLCGSKYSGCDGGVAIFSW